MKRSIKIIALAMGLFAGGVLLSFAASCIPVTNQFPISLNNFTANQCVPSSWGNTLEQLLGSGWSNGTSTSIHAMLQGTATTTLRSTSSTITKIYWNNAGGQYPTSSASGGGLASSGAPTATQFGIWTGANSLTGATNTIQLADGTVSTTALRTPSSTITSLTVGSCTGCSGGGSGTNQFNAQLSPLTATFPNNNYAQTQRYDDAIDLPIISFPPGTSSIAEWWIQTPASSTYAACNIEGGVFTTSTTAFASSTGLTFLSNTYTASSTFYTSLSTLGNVTTTFATSSPAVTSSTPPKYFSVSFSSSNFTAGQGVLLEAKHPSTDPFGGALMIAGLSFTCQ